MAFRGMAGGSSVANHRLNLYYMPDAKTERIINFAVLNGGLNVYDLPFRLGTHESPRVENLRWKNGAIGCRQGQSWLTEDAGLGAGIAAYDTDFWGFGFVHIGTKLYSFGFEDDEPTLTEIYSGLSATRGTFFRYQDYLFYKNKGGFVRIKYVPDSNPLTNTTYPFTAESVPVYTPVTYINMDPTTHAGDEYQPENRLSPKKELWYSAAYTTESQTFHLAIGETECTLDFTGIDAARFGGIETITANNFDIASINWNYDALSHKVTFDSPPCVVKSVNLSLSYSSTTPTQEYQLNTYDAAYEIRQSGITVKIDGVETSAWSFDSATNKVTLDNLPSPGAEVLIEYSATETFTPDAEIVITYKLNVNKYYLPVGDIDSVDSVIVDGVLQTVDTDYTVDLINGVITFLSVPATPDPFFPNTVKIVYSKSNPDAYNSIMDCPYATVYGGNQNVCIVVGGCTAQPNAYFWNGNHAGMDAGYWPIDQYNFGGDTEEAVTGFGKQQNMLVIFKTHSIGRSALNTATTSTERLLLTLDYTAINDEIGCDLPWSIQLVQNNLVFANTEQGVFRLKDSTSAYETNVTKISTKVNGDTSSKFYMLYDVRPKTKRAIFESDGETTQFQLDDSVATGLTAILSVKQDSVTPVTDYTADLAAGTITLDEALGKYHRLEVLYAIKENDNAVSFNDGTCYWLCCNGHCYVWDFELSEPTNPSWFFYTNFAPSAFMKNIDRIMHLNRQGRLTLLTQNFEDYGEGINKVYEFSPQFMGTYDDLKDVRRCIFAVRADTNSETQIFYKCDWASRYDDTPIVSHMWSLHTRDLARRDLSVPVFNTVAVRKPGYRHVRHFTMSLENNVRGEDLNILYAQLFYTLQRRDR